MGLKKKVGKRSAIVASKGKSRMRSSKKAGKASRVKKAAGAIISDVPFLGTASRAVSAFRQRPDGSIVRRKRINPMNAKAARKAASRVRASVNMLRRLVKSLPRQAETKARIRMPKRK
jgi:hypothetical protein